MLRTSLQRKLAVSLLTIVSTCHHCNCHYHYHFFHICQQQLQNSICCAPETRGGGVALVLGGHGQAAEEEDGSSQHRDHEMVLRLLWWSDNTSVKCCCCSLCLHRSCTDGTWGALLGTLKLVWTFQSFARLFSQHSLSLDLGLCTM